MRINTNVSAIQAATSLGRVQNALSDSIQKLSSGLRINKASDDAAGLGIANTLRAGTRVLTQAARNGEQASAMLNVAEGGASAIESIVERMKELAAQSASANSGDRVQLQAEFTTLSSEINRITNTTDYQGNKLIDGTMGNKLDAVGNWSLNLNSEVQTSTIQASGSAADTYTLAKVSATKISMTDGAGNVQVLTLGSSTGAQAVNFTQFGISFQTGSTFDISAALNPFSSNNTVKVVAGTPAAFLVSGATGAYATNDLVSLASSVSLGTDALGLTTGSGSVAIKDISSQATAQVALTALDGALNTINSSLGTIGAAQSRIGFALDNTKTAIANFTAAESTIRDVDMATEMTNFSKNQILAQAGTAMLAQANQSTQSVLKLFQ